MKWKNRTKRDDYIIPIDERGFQVRFPALYGVPAPYFGHKKYGSEQAALLEARRYRDLIVEQYGLDVPRRRRPGSRRFAAFIRKPRGNNSSGVVGVSCDGFCWFAFYHPAPGKQKRRSWAIKKYGYDEARELAIAWRRKSTSTLR